MVKLVSFRSGAGNRAGILSGEDVVDLECSMKELLDGGDGALDAAKSGASRKAGVPLASLELMAPVPEPRQIFCIGLNYADHAKGAGTSLPSAPLVFHKFASALCGPDAPIRLLASPYCGCLDYEVEQVAVIGKIASRISKEEAYDHVAGWMVGNDVSERQLQLKKNWSPVGPQWHFGKGFDGSGVCGPFLALRDEMPPERANNLAIRCLVNGEVRQDSNTKHHIFKPDVCIAHISQYVTLHPGDLVFLGTPAGTLMESLGLWKLLMPGRIHNHNWLKPGDVVTCEIEGLGSTSNTVVAEKNLPPVAKL